MDSFTYHERVLCTYESTDAIKCLGMESGEEVWIPKSQVHDDSEVWQPGHEGTLVITEWLAIERGWA